MSRPFFKWIVFSLVWIAGWWTFVSWQHRPAASLRWPENYTGFKWARFQAPEGEHALLVQTDDAVQSHRRGQTHGVQPEDTEDIQTDEAEMTDETEPTGATDLIDEAFQPDGIVQTSLFERDSEMLPLKVFSTLTGAIRWQKNSCEYRGFIPSRHLVFLVTLTTIDQKSTTSAEFVDLDTGRTVAAVPVEAEDRIWLRSNPPGFFRATRSEDGESGLTIEFFELKKGGFQPVVAHLVADDAGGSPDGRTWHHSLQTHDIDRFVYRVTFMDSQSGEQLGSVMSTESNPIYSTDGRRAFWESADFRPEGCELRPFRTLGLIHNATNYGTVISPGGRWVKDSGELYDLDHNRSVATAPASSLSTTLFCSDERHAVISGDDLLRYFDLTEAKCVTSWDGEYSAVGLAEPSSGPRIFATRVYQPTAVVAYVLEHLDQLPESLSEGIRSFLVDHTDSFDVQTGRTIERFPGQFKFVARDGSCLLTVRKGELLLWNLNRWRPGFCSIWLITILGPAVIAVWTRLASGRSRIAVIAPMTS